MGSSMMCSSRVRYSKGAKYCAFDVQNTLHALFLFERRSLANETRNARRHKVRPVVILSDSDLSNLTSNVPILLLLCQLSSNFVILRRIQLLAGKRSQFDHQCLQIVATRSQWGRFSRIAPVITQNNGSVVAFAVGNVVDDEQRRHCLMWVVDCEIKACNWLAVSSVSFEFSFSLLQNAFQYQFNEEFMHSLESFYFLCRERARCGCRNSWHRVKLGNRANAGIFSRDGRQWAALCRTPRLGGRRLVVFAFHIRSVFLNQIHLHVTSHAVSLCFPERFD